MGQSWRFGPEIADEANVWLGVVGGELRVVGAPGRESVLAKLDNADAVLCRSNAVTIDEVLAAHVSGTKVHLEGDGTEMLALARAAQLMQDGQPAEHPQLAAFADWAAVQAYAEDDPFGSDLAAAVRTIDNYGAGTVVDAIEGTVPAEEAQVVVSTLHKCKGLEWAKVRIADDFRQPRDPKTGALLGPGRRKRPQATRGGGEQRPGHGHRQERGGGHPDVQDRWPAGPPGAPVGGRAFPGWY